MTDQPGHLNAPDLVEECARAIFNTWRMIEGAETTWNDLEIMSDMPECHAATRMYRMAYEEAYSVLSVLRKRGLLTIQALEMLADK